jgi:hypothetical protein
MIHVAPLITSSHFAGFHFFLPDIELSLSPRVLFTLASSKWFLSISVQLHSRGTSKVIKYGMGIVFVLAVGS